MDDRESRRFRSLGRVRRRRADLGVDRLYESADRFASFDTPDLDVDEWEYERHRRDIESRIHNRPVLPPKPPLVSEAALRVIVGDLAPQAAGFLNMMRDNPNARTAATMAGMGALALVLPNIVK